MILFCFVCLFWWGLCKEGVGGGGVGMGALQHGREFQLCTGLMYLGGSAAFWRIRVASQRMKKMSQHLPEALLPTPLPVAVTANAHVLPQWKHVWLACTDVVVHGRPGAQRTVRHLLIISFFVASSQNDMQRVSQGQTCLDSYACWHTKTEVAEQACSLTRSQCTVTRPASLSSYPLLPGVWQNSYKSTIFIIHLSIFKMCIISCIYMLGCAVSCLAKLKCWTLLTNYLTIFSPYIPCL